MRCEHNLHLYANDYWCSHVRDIASTPPRLFHGKHELEPIYQSVEKLVERHDTLALTNDQHTEDHRKICLPPTIPCSSHNFSYAGRDLLDRTLEYRSSLLVKDKVAGDSCMWPKSPECFHESLTSRILQDAQGKDPTLFSRLRTCYQNVVEEILAMEHSDDPVLSNFKRQHGFEAYLCHYLNCPNATRGFSTAELRQQHEKMHAHRYHCIHSKCGMSEWTFNTRSALRNHNAKYHSEDIANQVPDTISRLSPHKEEKPRFSFDRRSPNNEKQRTKNSHPNLADLGNALGDLKLEDLPSNRKQKCNDYDVIYNPMIPRNIALKCNTFPQQINIGKGRVCLGPHDQFSVGHGDRVEAFRFGFQGCQSIPPPSDVSSHQGSLSSHCYSPCGKFLAIAWDFKVLRVSTPRP